MKNFHEVLTARSVNVHRPRLPFSKGFVKAHLITRRALPAFAIVGVTMAMASTAQADIEGKDDSKGGEAPGADLRCWSRECSKASSTIFDHVEQAFVMLALRSESSTDASRACCRQGDLSGNSVAVQGPA